MLRLFNTLGRKIETFQPVNGRVTTVFTCGPSIYQRAHIGNFRTFLAEDVLVRYLEFSGHRVQRGMNLTDIEDKALREAERRKTTVHQLTDENIRNFMEEMKLLRIKVPDYLPRASETVGEAVALIECLLDRGVAYWHRGNVYFDPLKFPGFGGLYGLDLSRWPRKRRRFHKDTYPGMQWNLGDFILWHGHKKGDKVWWDSKIGRGRPSWNIQDPGMISKHFDETLSLYAGGFDNLFRHHDYTRAILETVRPYPMARHWFHCYHLNVDGRKMSKSRGNIVYTDALLEQGYDLRDVRFFLIYGHYRKKLNYSQRTIERTTEKLRELKKWVSTIEKAARESAQLRSELAETTRRRFIERMDDDLDVRGAFDSLCESLSPVRNPKPGEAAALIGTLREIDCVLRVIF